MAEALPVDPEPFDCPECGSAGSAYRDFCEICEVEFGELCSPEAASLRAALSPHSSPRLLHPSIPLRFSDVIRELQEIAAMASAAVEVEGTKLASACRRAESLLRVLRAQFLQDVALDRLPGADRASSR
jgi:hypothetical protein